MQARVIPTQSVAPQTSPTNFSIRWLLREQFGNLGLAIAHTVIPPGGTSGAHMRENATEILFYLGGRATIEIEDGETHTVEPDTLVVIPPGTTHTHRNLGDEPIVQFFVQATVEST